MGHTWSIKAPADIGRTIADLRVEQGLTQAELASLTGVSRSYLAEMEAGHSVAFVERAIRILRRLGAEVTVTSRPPSDA
jgi:transcriptional regulator with XRE-family HTH domain